MNARILLVDDNEDLIDAMQLILEADDYSADGCYDYSSAINLIEKKEYDILFIDGKLPDHNGLDIFAAYRDIKKKGEVVMMSAYRPEQFIENFIGNKKIIIEHDPAEIILEHKSKASFVNIIMSGNCEDLVNALPENSENNFMLLDASSNSDECKVNSGHIIIHGPLKVMENILTMYRIYLDHPDTNFTMLVDSSEFKHPMKKFSSCGCLNKPFEPEQMLEIIEQIV